MKTIATDIFRMILDNIIERRKIDWYDVVPLYIVCDSSVIITNACVQDLWIVRVEMW